MDAVAKSEIKLAISSMMAGKKSLDNADDHLHRAMKDNAQLTPLELRMIAESRAIVRACLTLLRYEPDFLNDIREP